MPSRIEDYALLGDCRSAALVGMDGSIDWMCLPRFDSDACFAALLGTSENGLWKIAPATPITSARRAYRESSLSLETEHTCDDGIIRITDFMPIGDDGPGVVRIVTGVQGSVRVRSELVLRFNYGMTVPWVQHRAGLMLGIQAIAGPDLVRLLTPAPLHGEGLRTIADFVVNPGDRVPFVLQWRPSWLSSEEAAATTTSWSPLDADQALAQCDAFWQEWSSRCLNDGPYSSVIKRSLLTLKALTFAATGGIVAAPTTSLPEWMGSTRNWDYRFCWLRDATFTLYALMNAGFQNEARAWRDWLLRAAAGAPDQLQIMYGVAGERRLTELEIPWLCGYGKSKPVRIGNGAATQMQLDVYGELSDTLYLSNTSGLSQTTAANVNVARPNTNDAADAPGDVGLPDADDTAADAGWALQRALLGHLESAWTEPDHGIWEVRGPRRHFVHSKVMCWVAFDRGVKSIQRWGFAGPLEHWQKIRAAIHADVCANGLDPSGKAFAQYYGSAEPDASLLLLPIVGFLPPDDPRIIHTVMSIEKHLLIDRFVRRYVTHPGVDGLPEGEGAFLACSFWYVDALVLLGRYEEAQAHFQRLLALANDVGLFAEEYDPLGERMLGNFPQALSHVALVNSAMNLTRAEGPAWHRHAM